MKIDIKQIYFIDSKLQSMLLWLESKTGMEFTITSLYRIDDQGVHGTLPLRGADLRMRDRELGFAIQIMINMHWDYDNSRPLKKCAILHGEGANMHLHLQAHPNTVFIDN